MIAIATIYRSLVSMAVGILYSSLNDRVAVYLVETVDK